MMAKELQRRNEKAQQLRVIQVEEGSFFVESGDGKIAYKALFTDDKEYCSCPDFQRNGQTDPNFRCKHLLAIQNCVPEGAAEKKAFLKKRQPKLDERFVKNIEGKDFVLYAGLLDLAHQKGLTSMEVEILQMPGKDNGSQAIVKAYAESKIGETFSDVGDADPANCNAKVAKHLLRMASTRAKARALRDFTNIGMTCLEELGDLNEVLEDNSIPRIPRGSTRKPKTSRDNGVPPAKPQEAASKKPEAKSKVTPLPKPAAESQNAPKMSEAQKRAVYNLSRRRGISVEELQKMSQETYGVSLEELSAADASKFISTLQQSA
jgi:hypothetical protein